MWSTRLWFSRWHVSPSSAAAACCGRISLGFDRLKLACATAPDPQGLWHGLIALPRDRRAGTGALMLPKENYRVKTMSFGFFLEVRGVGWLGWALQGGWPVRRRPAALGG